MNMEVPKRITWRGALKGFLYAHRKYVAALCIAGASSPFVGFGALEAYILHRVATQPPHDFIARPLVRDDGSMLIAGTEYPASSRWQIIKRVVELLCMFGPLLLAYYVMRVRTDWYDLWLEWLVHAFSRAGPAFIKAGQWGCTRNDVFPPKMRTAFQRLFNEIGMHPPEHTYNLLKEELQIDDVSEVFESLDPVPLQSASIGQVHLAYMKDTQEKVVVKVMHPTVLEVVNTDFFIINTLAEFLDTHFSGALKYNNIKVLAMAWTNHLAAQLDFRIEHENLIRFRRNFKDVDYAEFPRPIRSTVKILIESFVPGAAATEDFLRSQPPRVRHTIALKALNTSWKMLLRDNFVHGDVHPGNILIDVENPGLHGEKITVTLVDAGLCQALTTEETNIAKAMLESFVVWRSDLCADAVLAMDSQGASPAKETKFKEGLHALFEQQENSAGGKLVLGCFFERVFDVVRQNSVTIDPCFSLLMFSMLILEGYTMTLDDKVNMIHHVAPWLVSEGYVTSDFVYKTLVDKFAAV